jgi:hypothetical protein
MKKSRDKRIEIVRRSTDSAEKAAAGTACQCGCADSARFFPVGRFDEARAWRLERVEGAVFAA